MPSVKPGNGSNLVWSHGLVDRADRARLNGHHSVVIWLTGFSGAGKSTIAHAVEKALHDRAWRCFVLDGDNVRHGLCGDLGFTPAERSENLRRVAETARLFVEAGSVVLAAFISPMRSDREHVRQIVGPENFIEVFVDCPVEVCEQRDIKGMYRRARAGELAEFTGISAPYEVPLAPTLVLRTHALTLEACAQQIIELIEPALVLDKDAVK